MARGGVVKMQKVTIGKVSASPPQLGPSFTPAGQALATAPESGSSTCTSWNPTSLQIASDTSTRQVLYL